MEEGKNYGFATRQIHAGAKEDAYGSLCQPIYQTSTFKFQTVEQGGARFAGEEAGYIYTRLGNPTQQVLEERMASLENGEAALATASGMGAITSALWSAIDGESEILADETLYGCTFALLTHGMSKFGVKLRLVDMTNPENIREHLNEKTKVVYFESPCNPTLKIVDIEAVSRITHEYNPEIKVMVDNTFSSPYLQRPLDLGADVVLHSATKYLNGHGDVIAGIIVGKKDFIDTCRMFGLKDMTGAVIGPFDAFLLIRGLKTLDIRMDRHCKNTRLIAEFLKGHPAIKKVYYPGFEDFSGHEVAKKQMSEFGGMVAVETYKNKAETAAALNHLKLATIAVSLGDAETLVEHPATMTHSTYNAEELAAANIPEGLVRISVGLENPEDIIADFKQVFDRLI
ncbi:methionine gamma-lyase [Tyzzerella sp. OttesenSCG-928-J15]|nr:methionine gamma-lyase [Tyzzerella sp. OttesenSCG-928-J15]